MNLLLQVIWMVKLRHLVGKNLTNHHEFAKFANIFSLQIFPSYGIAATFLWVGCLEACEMMPTQPMKSGLCVKFSQQAKVSVAKYVSEHGVVAALRHDVGHSQMHNKNHVIKLIINPAILKFICKKFPNCM